MSLPQRLDIVVDRAPMVLMTVLLTGSALAFGGVVWWARPAILAATLLLLCASGLRATRRGSWSVLKSPMLPLGVLALGLGIVQLIPLPGELAERLSPRARALYTDGPAPGADQDPGLDSAALATGRTPASLDRPATLRWLVGAAACLALFGIAAHDVDRRDRTLLLWGSVVAPLFLATVFGLVQWFGGAQGLYGVYQPGEAPSWAPSLADELAVPGRLALSRLDDPEQPGEGWIVARPEPSEAIGGLMGGPGAYLALASLALPLALGLVLQGLAPRGSREPLRARLAQSGRGGIVALFLGLTLLSAALAGMLAGRHLAIPLGLGLALAGLPGARAAGTGWTAPLVTLLALATLGGGVLLGENSGQPAGGSPLGNADGWPAVRSVWTETARIGRDFPLLGSGLGSFPTVHPHYKAAETSTTTAWSSLLRWWSEAGLAGLVLLGLAGFWCLVRLPGALRRLGTADRPLGFALVGSVAAFASFSAIHWTAELPAIALAACAVGGSLDRWLAGGTDLFVERT